MPFKVSFEALPDSVGTPVSFERGIQGLTEAVGEVQTRTAGLVGYAGEWHSHPARVAPAMSPDDLPQIVHVTLQLCMDGDPCVMLIVGDLDCPSISARVGH
jgi:hypothetical protein